jgi:hypothetical protein
VGSQSVSQSVRQHAAIAHLTIARRVRVHLHSPAKAARLPSHAHPLGHSSTNTHLTHLDHRRTIHMACRHGDAGCPWGPRLERTANAHKIDILVFRSPPCPHHHDLLSKQPLPMPPSSAHRLTYPSLSLAPLYICPPLVADCLSPGFSFHPDRDPLLIHFTRQRPGTARTVFICMSSSGHRIFEEA